MPSLNVQTFHNNLFKLHLHLQTPSRLWFYLLNHWWIIYEFEKYFDKRVIKGWNSRYSRLFLYDWPCQYPWCKTIIATRRTVGIHPDSVEGEWFCKHLRYLPCGWISDPSSAKYTWCWLKKSLYTSTKHSQIAALKCRAQTRLAPRAKRRHFGRFCALQRYRNRPVRKKNHYFLHRWSKVSKVELYGRLYGFEIQTKILKTFSVFLWKATIKLKFLPGILSLLSCVPWAILVLTRRLCICLFVPVFQLFTWNRDQWLAYSDLFSWTLIHASEHTLKHYTFNEPFPERQDCEYSRLFPPPHPISKKKALEG